MAKQISSRDLTNLLSACLKDLRQRAVTYKLKFDTESLRINWDGFRIEIIFISGCGINLSVRGEMDPVSKKVDMQTDVLPF